MAYFFSLFGLVVSYYITIKPKNYILYPQGLLNSLDSELHATPLDMGHEPSGTVLLSARQVFSSRPS